MFVRLMLAVLLIISISSCAQTRQTASPSKYEKSVEFVGMFLTEASLEEALQQAFLEYKQENITAPLRLSDVALEEINALLSREMLRKRGILISKIATLFTDEFTDAEIIALHSIKDFETLSSAHKKIKHNVETSGTRQRLTTAEQKAVTSLKNIDSFTTALPKLENLKEKIEQSGHEFSEEIISSLYDQVQEIIQRNEPLVGAKLLMNKQQNTYARTTL